MKYGLIYILLACYSYSIQANNGHKNRPLNFGQPSVSIEIKNDSDAHSDQDNDSHQQVAHKSLPTTKINVSDTGSAQGQKRDADEISSSTIGYITLWIGAMIVSLIKR